MRILYIFPGNEPPLDWPDTQRYGADRLSSCGFLIDKCGRDDALPNWLRRGFLGKLIGFKLRHALLYFKARKYDIVFGPALIYLMPLKKLFGGQTKYVVLDIELNRILRGAHGLRRSVLTSLVREFSAIVCLSNSQLEWLIQRYPDLEERTFFVPLCADTNFFEPKYERRDDFVLSVGGDMGRDYNTLLEAARQMPEIHFEVVCSKHNLANFEDIPTNVSVSYDLSFQELLKKYLSARMIVIPTHDDDSTNGADCSGQTVLLDSIASGLPAIVTQKSYLSDYVRDGEDVLVVPSKDPAALTRAIQLLYADGGLRERLARNARSRAEREFSVEAMVNGLALIFERVGNKNSLC